MREAGSSPGGDLHSSGTYGPFYKMPPAGIFDLRIFITSSGSVMTEIIFMGDAPLILVGSKPEAMKAAVEAVGGQKPLI